MKSPGSSPLALPADILFRNLGKERVDKINTEGYTKLASLNY